MSTDDDRKALERFVAGVPVDAGELATAITAKAVDRTIVIGALLQGLDSPEPVIRRRAAQRVARMPDVAGPIEARLRYLAASDEDERTRDACAAALQTHRLPPVDAAPEAREKRDRRLLHQLWIRGFAVRSAEVALEIGPQYDSEATLLEGRLYREADAVRIELKGLPEEFVRTRPTLRVRREGTDLTPIARAAAPVSDDGTVVIRVALEGFSAADLEAWLDADENADLIVTDDD